MPKMIAPGFPRRRPGGYVRYILVAIILALFYYTFYAGGDNTRVGSVRYGKSTYDEEVVENPHIPSANDEKTYTGGGSSKGSSFWSSKEDKEEAPVSNHGPATDDDKAKFTKTRPSEQDDDDGSHIQSGGYSNANIGEPDIDDENEEDVDYSKSKASDSTKPKTGTTKPAADDTSKSKSDSKTGTTKTGTSKTGNSKSGSSKSDDDETPKSKTGGNSETNADDVVETPKKGSKGKSGSTKTEDLPESISYLGEDGHPIEKLIYDAQHSFAGLIATQSKTVEQAALAYRKRRGRHPPPGFDKWYKFASSKNALIVEDFFDQVYHDLEPFWGMPAGLLRKESSDFEMTINIRNGTASAGSDWFWTQIWLNMTKSIEEYLPDMDLALNAMDEPRLVVPWEEIDEHMSKASKTKGFPKAKDVVSEFQELPQPGKGDEDVKVQEKTWENTRPYWKIARRGCAPDSKARKAEIQNNFEDSPSITDTNAIPHMYEGYVSNYTLSNELCHQPDLQGLEGILISPLSVSATKTMFPMFGGSKLTINNEILLPAPMYWNEEERFTGGDDHGVSWKEKKDKVIWRGVATGGKNTEQNWRGFQRHRFVAMNNGTTISRAEAEKEDPENFVLPNDKYALASQKNKDLGPWVDKFADVSFIDLMCDPPTPDGSCNYTGHYFKQTFGLKMAQQFDNKFLPDIDGNSFSGRYLGFLRSTSLPIKSTIWREWHDSRLVAWKHFVPMDNRFGDFYGIMEYFLGYNGKGDHDKVAEKIATEGKEWAERVLRKEDMQIYVFRLLLEYARILDDKRENLGWVDDILKDPTLETNLEGW